MQGYQLSFFTQQDRRHDGRPLAHWLLELARELGIGGATVLAASEGFGRERRIHAAHFVELAEQPLEVQMAVSSEQCERLFARLAAEDVRVFYTKAAIEFGVTGGG
jgi:PII-like signaling protein